MSKVNTLAFASAIGKLGAFLNFAPRNSAGDTFFTMLREDRMGDHELCFTLHDQKVFYSYKEPYSMAPESVALFKYIIAELGFDLEIHPRTIAQQMHDQKFNQTGQPEQEHDKTL